MNIGAQIDKRWERLGYEALLSEEREYLAVWWLVADVNNGGFHQYFTNSSGDTALLALDGLRNAGAGEMHTILVDALKILDAVGGYSADRNTRSDRIDALPEDGAEFDAADERFYNRTEESLPDLAARVVKAYERAGLVA